MSQNECSESLHCSMSIYVTFTWAIITSVYFGHYDEFQQKSTLLKNKNNADISMRQNLAVCWFC